MVGVDTYMLRTAKDKLSALLDQVERTHERITITSNGRPAAMLVSADDVAELEETLDVLSDPATMARVHAARAELDRGEGLDADGLPAFLSTPTY